MKYARSVFMILFLFFVVPQTRAEEIRDFYSEPGFSTRTSVMEDMHERISPFSGSLQLNHTDIVIPGNGGLDIRISRVYNHLQDEYAPGEISPVGIGWTLHFGRILTTNRDVDKLCTQGSIWSVSTADNPSIEFPDGSRELLVAADTRIFSQLGVDDLITASNWRAACNPKGPGLIVTSPTGIKYTMDKYAFIKHNGQTEPSWYTSKIEDVHGNWISIQYLQHVSSPNTPSAIQHQLIDEITSSDGRLVDFEYEINSLDQSVRLSTIVSNNQTWRFHHTQISGSYYQLDRVDLPENLSWNYQYFSPTEAAGRYSLSKIIYPYGAEVSYSYKKIRFDLQDAKNTTVLASKSLAGVANVSPGRWDYDYAPSSFQTTGNDPGFLDVTTVTGPTTKDVYYHPGAWSAITNVIKNADGSTTYTYACWQTHAIGLLWAHEVYDLNENLMERIENTYTYRKISDENLWHGRQGWRADDDSSVAMLSTRRHIRDGYAWESTYSNYDHYGNAGLVTQMPNLADEPARTTRYVYENNTEKWILGLVTEETLDTIGTIKRSYYSENGLLRTQTRLNSMNAAKLYEYWPTGDLYLSQDALGVNKTYLNYKRGQPQQETHAGITRLTRVINDTGTVASVTDGRGYTKSFSYDGLGRLTAIDFPIHDDVVISRQGAQQTLMRGAYQKHDVFNGLGQLIKSAHRSPEETILVTTEYDALGRRVFVSNPNSALGTHNTYDALNRLTRVNHADGSFLTTEYAGESSYQTDEVGNRTEYLYRSFGGPEGNRALKMVYQPAEHMATIYYRNMLNLPDQIAQVQVNNDSTVSGFAYTYGYDNEYRLVREQSPRGTTYAYDAIGNKIFSERDSGSRIAYAYDSFNRLITVDYLDADATPDVTYTYDLNDNLLEIQKGSTSRIYKYDENNNRIKEQLNVANEIQWNLERNYNNLDHLALLTYPSGLSVNYAPNALGRPTQVSGFVSNISYHPNGALASLIYANGHQLAVTQTERQLVGRMQIGAGTNAVDLEYNYDQAGNVQSLTDRVLPDNSITSLIYDGAHRLRSASSHWGDSAFNYDALGNITSKTLQGETTTYDYAGNLLHKVSSFGNGTVYYSYDANGNIIDNGRSTLNYDAAGHMIKITTGNNTQSYAYDGDGSRVARSKGAGTVYSFSSDNTLLFELDLSISCKKTEYIHLGSMILARRDALLTDDADHDGASDCTELILGLDSHNPDSDADGMPDGYEVTNHLNPLVNDASLDKDGDGLLNLDEYRAGTRADNPDTDGDRLQDGAERSAGLDPLNGSDAAQDDDGDGHKNYLEIWAGSDPFNPASKPTSGTYVTRYPILPEHKEYLVYPSAPKFDLNGKMYVPVDIAGTNGIVTFEAGKPWTAQKLHSSEANFPTDELAINDKGSIIGLMGNYVGAALRSEAKIYSTASYDSTNQSSSTGGQTYDSTNQSSSDGQTAGEFYCWYNCTSDTASSNTSSTSSTNNINDIIWGKVNLGVVTFPTAGPDMPSLGFDNTMYALFEGSFSSINLENLKPNWSAPFNGQELDSVLGADGTIYLATTNHENGMTSLAALNLDGSTKWQLDRDIAAHAAQTGQSQGYFRNLVPGLRGNAIIDDHYQIFSVDAYGEMEWSLTHNSGGTDLQFSVGTDGTVYGIFDRRHHAKIIEAWGGERLAGFNTPYRLWAINEAGAVSWTFDVLYGSPPAIASDGTLYFIGVRDEDTHFKLFALKPDGSIKWILDPPSQHLFGIDVTIDDNGFIYVPTYGANDNTGAVWVVWDDNGGIADSPWPMKGHDIHNSRNQCYLSKQVLKDRAACQAHYQAMSDRVPQHQLPSLAITTPKADTALPLGQTYTFTATAYDPLDGDLSANITWQLKGGKRSAYQGKTLLLGQGPSITFFPEEGWQEIIAQTSNSRGQKIQDTLPVLVAGSTPSGLINGGGGETWHYLDIGQDLGSTWKEPDFDDSAWKTGLSTFGYGKVDKTTTISYGHKNNKYPTTYFRKTLDLSGVSLVDDVAVLKQVRLSLRSNVGAIVYLNGVEVARSNMPAGDISYNTYALSTSDFSQKDLEIPKHLLKNGSNGKNVLAVEVHINRPTAQTLFFDLGLGLLYNAL